MTPVLLIALIISTTLLMMQMGIGPFGHPAQLHWHQKVRAWPAAYQTAIRLIAGICFVLTALQLLGITQF